MHNFQTTFMRGLTGVEVSMDFANSQIPKASTWDIYRRNYLENHIAALADTYSAVRDLVGEDYFRQLARAYVPTQSSRSADLNAYGAEFPAFLEREIAFLPSGENLPYLADMARLDWAAFHLMCGEAGASTWIADLQAMDERDWPRMKIDAAAHCLRSAVPVSDIWRMQQGEELAIDLSLPQAVLLTIRLDADGSLQVQLLTAREAQFLSHWFAGATLEQALESTCTTEGDHVDEELDVLAVLNRLAQAQAIRRLYLEDES